MSEFSIVIVAKDRQSADGCIKRLREIYQKFNFEAILVCGNNPSEQRNYGAKLATGRYVLFLDNDSIAAFDLLEQYKNVIKKIGKFAAIGGPSLQEYTDDVGPDSILSFSHLVNFIYTSSIGVGPVKARYQSVGDLRLTTEKELILCNLLVDRKIFLENNGLNTDLYPNEENEYLARVSDGKNIWYSPDTVVFRQQREGLYDLIYQAINYGKGRLKSFLKTPRFYALIYFSPAVLLVYTLFVSIFVLLFKAPIFLFLPILVYLIVIFGHSFVRMHSFENKLLIFKYFSMIVLVHFSYGLGLMLGILDKVFKKKKMFKLKSCEVLLRFNELKEERA